MHNLVPRDFSLAWRRGGKREMGTRLFPAFTFLYIYCDVSADKDVSR